MMKMYIENNRENMGIKAADIIKEAIIKKPDIVLSLPTGSTPIVCLEQLVKLHKQQGLDFSRAYCFNMDEYIALEKKNPNSNYYYLNEYLYQHVNIDKGNTFCPDVLKEDKQEICDDYSKVIMENGGIDLILLGIGSDGHIAFNMPAEELQLHVHVERLSEKTIKDNSRFFDNVLDVPTQAITFGIKDILSSRKIVLIADGKAKSKVIGEFLNFESITTKIPASFLWLHNDVTIILDEQAASSLQKK